MRLAGSGVIAKWAYGLVHDTGAILLDGAIAKQIRLGVVTTIEEDADNCVTDIAYLVLHIWHVGQNHLAATISLMTHYPQAPEHKRTCSVIFLGWRMFWLK